MKEAAIAAVLRFAERRTGLTFSPAQADLAAAGVRRAMGRAGVREPGPFLALLSTDAAACDLLLEELAVGETYFCREPDQLAFIRDSVLPELAARRDGEPIRAWSAACATGEEAYTLAMLLREGRYAGSRVLGTDVVRSRLAVAANATYGRWSLRGLAPETTERVFERIDGRFRVRPELRSMVDFRALNLADDRRAHVAAGAWGMHLVLCRNVLIYLDPATVRHVATRLMEALEPGGWLFLGASDPSLGALAPFEAIQTGAGVAYRKPQGSTAPRVPAAAAPRPHPQRADPHAVATVASVPAAAAPPPDSEDTASWAGRVRSLADRGELGEATSVCSAALEAHRDSPELLVLHSTLLFAARRFADAAAAGRSAVYLDRGSAVAHLALGSALARTGDARGAGRAFRNAASLLRALPAGDPVAHSGGETAARLLAVAESQLHVLGDVA